MTKYSKGAKFENDVIKYFRSFGYFCIRSAGSKTIVDVIAISKDFTYFIQCKYGKTGMNKKDKKKLVEIANRYNANPIYITRDKYERNLNIINLNKELTKNGK